jgi:hypothetical protein
VGDGDDDQDDAQPGPVASSTSDATVRDASEACWRSAPLVSMLLRELGDFSLHSQGRPCGRPPAAAVLGRLTNLLSSEQPEVRRQCPIPRQSRHLPVE